MYSFVHGGVLPLTDARGCPFNCIFCYSTYGKKVGFRSLDLVLDEMERGHRDFNVVNLFFTDETFAVDKKRSTQLCEYMLSRGLHFFYHSNKNLRRALNAFNVDNLS